MTAASIYEGQSVAIPVANSLGNIFLEWKTATAGQTVFNIVSFQYTPGTHTLMVYRKPVGDVGGYFMQLGIDYTETDADTVTIVTPATIGDKWAFLAFATSGVAIPNGGGVPSGGTAGQILSKIDNSDYNTQWINQATAVPLLDAPIAVVASANTVDLTPLANITRNITLTGTTPIAGFQLANGQLFSCMIAGTFSFVHSVALSCPGSVSIAATPTSSCFIRANADNSVEIISYSSAQSNAIPVDHRQSALAGEEDANGNPAFLVAGAGLAVDLVATANPLTLTYAGGYGADGTVDFVESLAVNTANVVTGLAASNLSYITKLYQGAWGKTLAPFQHGKIFDKTAQLLFRWPGANNAVASTEDFGNTLTFAGDAKLSTAVQILGLNTVALDGTGDYVSTPFTSLGRSSWEIFGSFRTSSLAATQTVLNLCQAGSYRGVMLRITTAGILQLYLSSDGASDDIAGPSAGATTIVINTTYYYRITYDAVGGTYRVYLSNNGAAEVQDSTVSSALKVCSTVTMLIGAQQTPATFFNGNIGFTGVRRWASFTSAQSAGPTVAPTFASVKLDWYSKSKSRMYEVTAASTVSGTDPTLTAVNRLYVADVTTNGAAVTAVANYAYGGVYDSNWFAVAAGGIYPITHNLGWVPESVEGQLKRFTNVTEKTFIFTGGYTGLAIGSITNKSLGAVGQTDLSIPTGTSTGLAGGQALEARLFAKRW